MNSICDSIYTVKADLVIMVKSLDAERKRNKKEIRKLERILELMIEDKVEVRDYIKKVNNEFDHDVCDDQLRAEEEAIKDSAAQEKLEGKKDGLSRIKVKIKQHEKTEDKKGKINESL